MRRPAFALLSLVAFALPARAAAQSIPAGPGGQLSSLVGVPFDVPIVFDLSARTEKLGSFAARISWDPAVLRFDAGLPGNFGSVTANQDSAPQGIVYLAGANPTGVGGVVTVGNIRLTPVAVATSTIDLTVTEAFAAGSFADLLPSVSASVGTFCPAIGRYGDIDQDGAAGSRDALIALSNAVGLPVAPFNIALGDVDASGATNARDALIILSHAVGLDVSAYLVMRLAPGACTTPAPVTLAIAPALTGDLVPGDQILFEARATDATGNLQAVTDAAWTSSNPQVLAVLSTGLATARDTGTAVVTAVRDGRDTAQVTLRVVARRSVWYVSATAVSADNRVGTSVLPLASLREAAARNYAAGDTIVLMAGRYVEGAAFRAPIVILGQSSGGVDAVLTSSGGQVGLSLDGPGVSEIHNLGIEGFQTALFLGSVDTVLVDSLRVLARGGPNPCFNAGIEIFEAWLVTVRRSQLVGDGNSGCASGIETIGNVRTLVVEDATITDFGDAGIYAGGGGAGVDSLVVRRSSISDNGYYGIYAYTYIYSPPGRVPTPTSVALVVEDSRLLRHQYPAVYAYTLRLSRIARTVIVQQGFADALSLDGNDSMPSYLELVGDSIILADGDWLSVDGGIDSVVVDSVRVVGGSSGWLYDLTRLRVANSSFTELTCGNAFYLSSSSVVPPTQVAFDSVTVRGGSRYSRCQDGITGRAYGTFNRTIWDNLSDGIYLSGSAAAATVTNSAFTGLYNGVYVQAFGAVTPPRVRVANSSFTDTDYSIEAGYVTAVVESVTVTRGYDAIWTWGTGSDTVRLNTLTDVSSRAIDVNGAAYVANNTIVRAGSMGISGGGALSTTDSLIIVNNVITCGPGAASLGLGIQVVSAVSRVSGNSVGGCGYGLYAFGPGPGLGTLFRSNTVSQSPTSGGAGIFVNYGVRARVVGNTVTGGGPFSDGGIYLSGSTGTFAVPWALVDSNSVQATMTWGIRAQYTDSLEIRGNLVEDVASAFYYLDAGAIGLTGNFLYLARVAGNTIRRPRGFGVGVNQLDTATVLVDSNAVSLADSAAVRLYNGLLFMRGNNVRNNPHNGVRFEIANGIHQLHGNAFQGSGLYAVDNTVGATVDATGNWWGVDGQPPGVGGADSVFNVTDPSPLAAAPPGLPPLAPPASRLVTAVGRATNDAGEIPPAATRLAPRVRRAVPVWARPDRPPDAARARRSAEGPDAARLQHEAERVERMRAAHAARLAAQAERDSARAERVARREALRRRAP